MTTPNQKSGATSTRAGMTLIEMTIVILVLLFLVGVLSIGATSWKRGSDRGMCIVNQYHMQEAVRSYANLNGLGFGQNTALLSPPVDLKAALLAGGYIDEIPECPGNGVYSLGGDVIPDVGELYVTCSLADDQGHRPRKSESW